MNPDEYLNQDVKANAVGRRCPENQRQLIRDVRSYLYSAQRRPEIVQQFFRADDVRYAAMYTISYSR